MNFFKPTWKKVGIALILTIWPYIVSLLFVVVAHEGSIFSDSIVQFSFWTHAWSWSPFYLIAKSFTHYRYNGTWQTETFLLYGYPILRFSIRYIISCAAVSYGNKLLKKRPVGKYAELKYPFCRNLRVHSSILTIYETLKVSMIKSPVFKFAAKF